MSSKTQVHTLSFRFPDYLQELSYQCKVLAFPSKWKGFIDDLAKEPKWKNYPPSGSPLKKLLLALLPELITANYQLTSRTDLNWLYSKDTFELGLADK
jgi:hypothetical protein